MKLTKRQKALAVGSGMTAVEAVFLKSRSGSLIGLRTIVRCNRGHLFTTIWIPGASVKSLRLGPWRVQRCPVGHHWAIVTPAQVSKLSERERDDARAHHDTFVP
jgi:hypothetical protein